MSLTMIATPLGNSQDLSPRALAKIKSAEVIVLEERKEGSVLLRDHGISGRTLEILNEHSTPEDVDRLAEMARTKEVIYMPDCGTPSFCDPGFQLVKACRQKNIAVHSLPGPSSTASLLSLTSQRIDEFVFRGFIPVEKEEREKALKELTREKRAIILLDTPYRFQRTLDDLEKHFPHRKVLLGCSLTQESEMIVEDFPGRWNRSQMPAKCEFILLIYP